MRGSSSATAARRCSRAIRVMRFGPIRQWRACSSTTTRQTHEQGSDRPGRAYSSVGKIRSSVEQTDWHDIEEHRFARKVAQTLGAVVRSNKVKKLFVVAPARTLVDLRAVMHEDVRKVIVAELDKDLTRHPVHEIARLLAGVGAR